MSSDGVLGGGSASSGSQQVASRVRQASHAGSWYSDNPKELDRQLSDWLDRAGPLVNGGNGARAVITPHAGYTYCGDTAAYAFKQIVPDRV